MKRAWWEGCFLVALFIVIIFSGCSREKSLTSKKKTINFSITWEALETINVFEKIIQSFNETHPDIRVRLRGGAGGISADKILTELAGGAGADVMTIHYTFFHDFARRGVFLNLDPYIQRDKYDLDDFFKIGTDSYIYEGNLYAIPYKGSARVIIYNKTLFDEANLSYPGDNWTWVDYLENAKKLTKDVNGDGKVDRFGTLFENGLLALLPWIWSNGGDWLSEDGKECTVDSPEVIEAVRFCTDWIIKYHVAPTSRDLTAMMGDVFSTGKIGMFISGPWSVTTFRKIKNFTWDVALFPKGKGGRVSRYAGMGYCIWKSTSYPEEAWEFVRFLADPEKGAKMLAEAGLDVPTRKSLANSPIFLSKETPWHEEEFVKSLEGVRSLQQVSSFFEIDSIFKREVDLVILGQRTVKEAMEIAKRKIDLLLVRK